MVQEFHVVRCFSCECFQTQQVCKKPKFTCKVCGAKQSVRKEYGRGSGKDCRIHVQKLNGLVGSLEVEQEQRIDAQLLEREEFEDVNHFGYQDGCDGYQEGYEDHQGHQLYQELYSHSLYGADDPGTLAEECSETGNMAANAFSAKKNSKWSTYLMNEDEADDVCEDKTSPFSTPRQVYSQNGARRKTKGSLAESSGLHTSVEEADPFQIMIPKEDGNSGLYFKLPVKTTPSPTGKATAPRKQNQLGPVGIPRLDFQESLTERKGKWNSDPYLASGSSQLSGVCKSRREFSQAEDVGFPSSQAEHTLRSHDVASKRVQSALSNKGLKNIPLKEKSGNSFIRSHCDRPSSNHVMPLKEKSGDSFNRSCYRPPPNQALKRKLRDDDPDSELGTGKLAKPQQLDHKSIGAKKQQSLISCIENSTSAAFKKYELADDADDINFDL